ncbi:hypothetical protein [Pyrococcus kukulkanii]|uniref:Uncharacterized protein n=1 Tax=Pyrococcus kukulkanii TaxID=1609559 RepID=A0ABV4T9V5_9EURY
MGRIKAQQIRLGDLWYRIEYKDAVPFSRARKDAISLVENVIKMIEILVEAKIVVLSRDELEKLEADLARIEKRIAVMKKELKKLKEREGGG